MAVSQDKLTPGGWVNIRCWPVVYGSGSLSMDCQRFIILVEMLGTWFVSFLLEA